MFLFQISRKSFLWKMIVIFIFTLFTDFLPAYADQNLSAVFTSHPMAYQADSEAQTASDIAAYSGYSVSPDEILNALPISDDPDQGFVGYYNQTPSLPPSTYGVYQAPLAAALNSLGISASTLDNGSIDSLKNLTDAGTPVMCWVVGNTHTGSTMLYTSSSGKPVTVAAGMNTVTVTDISNNQVTIFDNGSSYTRSLSEFELSWSLLGHRALIINSGNQSANIQQHSAGQSEIGWNSEWPNWDPETGEEISSQNYNDLSIQDQYNQIAQGSSENNSSIPEVTPDFSWNTENWPDSSDWDWNSSGDSENQSNPSIQTVQTTPIPESAYINGFIGYDQNYTLDCETRSAVDLAYYFGISIDHNEFMYKLPKSDDPNYGFVGSFNDPRGQIPPNSYGVYQDPVAALLRNYGLPAVGYKNYSFDQIRTEIAAGRPVMVWVCGNTGTGSAVSYTPSDGISTVVAPYQHTVIVIGYTAEKVMIQDGSQKYERSIAAFEQSWGLLENRAVVVQYN